MHSLTKTLTLLLILGFSTLGTQANADVGDKPGEHSYDHPGHVPVGEPGQADEITQTIEIDIRETESGYMLFDPDAIHIEKGSVVRFVISNSGALDHDFFLGSFDEVAKHRNLMQNQPEIEHLDPNLVAIPSGTAATLDWRFTTKMNLEFVCMIPGHREAGMWGVIIIHDHLTPKSRN